MAQRVKEQLRYPIRYGIYRRPSGYLPVITCAASLAHQRLLGSVRVMRLDDDDLTSVTAEHLASLVSYVTRCVYIKNVSGCGLVNIMESVKSRVLDISRQSLSTEETQALVRAMESGVEMVKLNY